MNGRTWRWTWLLVIGALAACVTAPSPGREHSGCEEAAAAVRFEAACAHESSLVGLCAGGQCGIYQCREVTEHLEVGRVVPARSGGLSLPGSQGRAQRNWGSAQVLPRDLRAVFIIPWRHKPPLLPSQTKLLEEAAEERSKPHERHHIFPRAFRVWFARQGIDIDEYVMPLEVEKHRSIHRGERGGPWNAAWKEFIDNNPEPPKEEIFRYAGELIYRFELLGPVVPYWKQPPPLPLGY